MMQRILNTRSLADVRDGLLGELLDEKLRKAYDDCADRPRLKKARTITLAIEVKPITAEGAAQDVLDEVDITFKVNGATPAQSFGRRMKPNARSKGFGFEVDTDSTAPAPSQKTFEGE